MSKDFKLRIFMMEIQVKNNKTQAFLSETIHMLDKERFAFSNKQLEDKLKSLAITLVEHKKNHSFLRGINGVDWVLDMCLVETIIFKSEQTIDDYIKVNKIKNGPLFGMSYNNFFF